MAVCSNCGNEAAEGAVFCDQCGARLPAPEPAAPEPVTMPAGGSIICPACGAGNVPGEAFCDYCGSPLEAPAPTAEDVPELEPVSSEAELEVAPAPEAPPTEEEAAAPPEEALTCPACGAEVQPDESFCANCGASLAQPPIPPEPVPEEAVEAELEPAPEVEPAVEEGAPAPEPEAELAVAEEAPAEVVVEEAPPAPPEVPTCPACGSEIDEADTFCSNCGAVLKPTQPPLPLPAEEEPAPPPPPAPPVGPRLVVIDSGAEIPLPVKDEILIGREDPVSGIFPDVDLTPHGGEDGGVSRRHARLIMEASNYFYEDLDSTNFSFVNKQKLAPKTRHPVGDGDEIRCGRVAMVLRTA